MKYMTFNGSCSYAGVANMLAHYGIDTDDRTIALEMGLPYYFARENGEYLSGPSLQSARWFDLYLNPLGFELDERALPNAQVPHYLRNLKCAMLGIHVADAGKHAVVLSSADRDGFHFLNNKWAHDPAPELLTLTGAELVARIDDPCMVAVLHPIPPKAPPRHQRMEESLTVLDEYRRDLLQICSESRSTAELRRMLDPMFRALLLDSITMLDLLGKTRLRERLTQLQQLFLTALHSDATEIRLKDYLPTDQICEAIADYAQLIQFAME